jgi:chromosome segregation ATPase
MATELEKMLQDLSEATKRLEEAIKDVQSANRAEIDALNTVNTLQKQVDKYMVELRSKAPLRSDWQQNQRSKQFVEVPG